MYFSVWSTFSFIQYRYREQITAGKNQKYLKTNFLFVKNVNTQI